MPTKDPSKKQTPLLLTCCCNLGEAHYNTPRNLFKSPSKTLKDFDKNQKIQRSQPGRVTGNSSSNQKPGFTNTNGSVLNQIKDR